MITVQYRLKPTKSQASKIRAQIEVHRILYNKCLEYRINKYKNENKSVSGFDLIKTIIPNFKKAEGQYCNYSSLQQTVRRLDKAYSSFFKKNSKFPRFKNRFRSIEFGEYGDGW